MPSEDQTPGGGPPMSTSTVEVGLDHVRVLVIDDDDLVRKLATTILTKSGCEVEAASDGREALHLLLLRDFDVTVVDLKMSGMDGLAFLTEALTICPWLGVIVVTGFARDEAVERARRLGVDHILKKPFDVSDLLELVFMQAAAKREKLKSTADISLGQIRNALSLFQEIGRSASESETLLDAVRALRHGLAFLEAEAMAVLSLDEDPVIMMFPHTSVTQEYINEFEAHVRRRYNAFSGRQLPAGIQVEVEGEVLPSGAKSTMGECFSVPIIAAGEIRGLLSIAAPGKDAYHESDMLFLYHAANLLATVLLTFRRMRQLVVRDSLTGLYNQRGVTEQLEGIWQLGKRYHYRVTIAMLDVDHFKNVNDTYGHPVGDMVLRELSTLVRDTVRASDIVGRYGGDELVIIFPNADQEDLKTFCDRLRAAVQDHPFCEGLHDLHLTVSIGIASSAGQDWLVLSSDSVVSQADKALYVAKQSGRDQVRVWSPEMSDTIKEELGVARSDTSDTVISADTRAVSAGCVMVVDDEAPILELLRRLLEAAGFEVTRHLTATDALEALRSKTVSYDVVLTDITLSQEETGFDVLQGLSEIDDTIVPIVMTGHATTDNAVSSLRHGVYDFISKPIDAKKLIALITRAVEYRRLRQDNRRYQMRLEDMVREKSRELALALERTKESYNFTLEAMVAMLDAREQGTGRHSLNVRELSLILGREMELTPDELHDLSLGALLHDIGKIAIPDAILLKPGPLTAEEWTVMRTHARVGYELVSSSPFLAGAAEIVLSHQEHYDGSGYPRALAGEDIAMGARIFAVVDAYDAMRSDRPYRQAMTRENAVAELRRCSGTQFDPVVVAATLRCLPQLERIRSIGADVTHGPAAESFAAVEMKLPEARA
ncbi:MAG: diguanylate cyclase [Verrucomicrobia bacterium]|nr:diguanylate cyclase [Verrucomicrobiota bacterium]